MIQDIALLIWGASLVIAVVLFGYILYRKFNFAISQWRTKEWHTIYSRYCRNKTAMIVFVLSIAFIILNNWGCSLKDICSVDVDRSHILDYLTILFSVFISFIILVAQSLWEKKYAASEILRGTKFVMIFSLVILYTLLVWTGHVFFYPYAVWIFTLAVVWIGLYTVDSIANNNRYINLRLRGIQKELKMLMPFINIIGGNKAILRECPSEPFHKVFFKDEFFKRVLEIFEMLFDEIHSYLASGKDKVLVEKLIVDVFTPSTIKMIELLPEHGASDYQFDLVELVLDLYQKFSISRFKSELLESESWYLIHQYFLLIQSIHTKKNPDLLSKIIISLGEVVELTGSQNLKTIETLFNAYIIVPIKIGKCNWSSSFIQVILVSLESLMISLLKTDISAFSSFANNLVYEYVEDPAWKTFQKARTNLALRILHYLNQEYLELYKCAQYNEEEKNRLILEYETKKRALIGSFPELTDAGLVIDNWRFYENNTLNQAISVCILQIIAPSDDVLKLLEPTFYPFFEKWEELLTTYNLDPFIGSSWRATDSGGFKWRAILFHNFSREEIFKKVGIVRYRLTQVQVRMALRNSLIV